MKTFMTFIVVAFVAFGCKKSPEIGLRLTAGNYSYMECPVSVNLSKLFQIESQHVELYEIKDGAEIFIPLQYDSESMDEILWFFMEGRLEKGESREYLLKEVKKKKKSSVTKMFIEEDEDEINIFEDNQHILAYRKTELLPPDSVDEIYKRSAFIHPLHSPGGEILTRIQPPDHYHHYGIWAPWTKTFINEREIDYWNLAKGEGTVRHQAILSKSTGPHYVSFLALQEHIDKGHSDGERVAMDEFWEIRYWGNEKSGLRYSLDLNSTFRNILEDTILLDAYRYGGGLGYRATARWKADNSSILTSEGHDRRTADGSRARWCILEGISDVKEGRSGLLFMSHPDNREHPEPMRVWPEDAGDGDVFFEFCPIRHTSWEIIPAFDYSLRYRIVVFDGAMSREDAEMYWNGFANAPQLTLTNKKE